MARVLERGDIFFMYRPRVDEIAAHSVDDVQRLYVILHARERDAYRRLVIGRKRMPELGAHERYWAYVDRVASTPEPMTEDLRAQRYATRTRGVREQDPARPVGEGVYAIADHDEHCHLAYRLALPLHPGAAQRDLRIESEASYIVAVFNPQAPPRRSRSEPTYPPELRARFAGRRFAPLAPGFLDVPGAELVLIAASGDVARELGIELDPQREDVRTAELFTELALDEREHPIAPLVTGDWA